jgi:hypothetical protein
MSTKIKILMAIVIVAFVIGIFTISLSRRRLAASQPTSLGNQVIPKIGNSFQSDQPVVVESPKTPAVPAKGEAISSPADDAVLLAQAELKATVQDIARTLREKGRFSARLDSAPPEFAASMQQEPDYLRLMLENEAEDKLNPHVQQEIEIEAQKYDYLATLTPTLNATGDKAIYYGNYPNEEATGDGTPQKIAILIKINGKWYWQADWSGE